MHRPHTWQQPKPLKPETPSDGDTPAWAISLTFHLVALVILTAMAVYVPKEDTTVSLSAMVQEPEILEPSSEMAASDVAEDKIGAPGTEGGGGGELDASLVSGGGSGGVGELVAEAAPPVLGTGPAVDLPVASVRLQQEVREATGAGFGENLGIPGAAGVGTSGTGGAVDRITQEILLSLEQRKTLVVWILDETPSLAPQREAIRQRFDRIYQELGVAQERGNAAFQRHTGKPLLSAVVGFGRNWRELAAPTDKLDDLEQAIDGIHTDDSGIENVFTTIYGCVERYRSYHIQAPRRNIMFVVLTDEAGDDEQGLDPTVAMCQRYQIPVYVIGVPAPFGQREALIKYIPPKQYEQDVMWVPVRQGPESFMPEVVNLAFASGQFREPMDSGFGPYCLTRLCYESGGIYFAVHPNRTSRRRVGAEETSLLTSRLTFFFDPDVMRSYRPDYVSIKQYEQLIAQNKARGALVEAARLTVAPMEQPPLRFPKIDDAEFVTELSKAQRVAAIVEPRLEMVYGILKTGEADRPKLTQPRWQAGYDLAMGRVLAAKVRAESYNAMLAKAKQGIKFKQPNSDTWILEPSDEISVGSALEKQSAQARAYLERVLSQHKSTPWALLAKAELDDHFGWTWREGAFGLKKRKLGFEGGGSDLNADDKKVMLKRPAPRAPMPRL